MKNLRLHKTFRTHYPTKATLAIDLFWDDPLKHYKRVKPHCYKHLQPSMGYKCSKNTILYTPISKRLLECVDSPIDRLIKHRSADNQYNRNKVNFKNITNLSEPGSDIR